MVAQPFKFWQNGGKPRYTIIRVCQTDAAYQLWLVTPAPHQFPDETTSINPCIP